MRIKAVHEFVGRAAELAALKRQYESSRSALVPVYGRRRVGKTELLLRFVGDLPAIYFMASDKLKVPQLADFMRAAAEWLGAPALAEAAPASWEAAIRLALSAAPSDRKLVLILDEFQWLCHSSPELPSVLQRLWDLEWQRTGRLMLVLCGSFVGFMEREVMGAKAPLHGRRTADLRLEPFGFREAAQFHPSWSDEENAKLYFVVGGIPAYLRQFEAGCSVAQTIAREFFPIDGFFQREPDYLLREELNEVTQASSILEAIGLGRRKQGEIANSIGLSAPALAPHLRVLTSLGYVERIFPLTPKDPPRTSVHYRISDPILRFWYRFIEPNWSAIRRHDIDAAYREVIAPQWDAYCGEGFERLCREALPSIYGSEGVPSRFTVGEYWDRETQIDVVGLRNDGWVDLGECKWNARVGTAEAAAELRGRAARYPHGGRTIQPRLFVRAAPKTAPAGMKVHSLSALYEH